MIRLALALALLAAPAAAQDVDPRSLEGQPVLALASHPAVRLTLRQSTGGRQSVVARLARAPGAALRLTPEGRYLYGWGCGEAGCTADGFFLGLDLEHEQIFVVIFAESAPLLWVPPRAAPWPAPLQAPLQEFSDAIAGRMRFAPP
jgi:hypothetical protein